MSETYITTTQERVEKLIQERDTALDRIAELEKERDEFRDKFFAHPAVINLNAQLAACREQYDTVLSVLDNQPVPAEKMEGNEAAQKVRQVMLRGAHFEDRDAMDWLSAQLSPSSTYQIGHYEYASQFYGDPPSEWSPTTPIGLGEFPSHFGKDIRDAIKSARKSQPA